MKKAISYIAWLLGIALVLYGIVIGLFITSWHTMPGDSAVPDRLSNNTPTTVDKVDSLSLIFIGDIMGHIPQVKSAYDPKTSTYSYEDVFSKVAPIIKKADFSVANLEVTLAGKPYEGYPKFSSPDALAAACKTSGIDVLLTANNHSCDRGKEGIVRTIRVLDSLDIQHTGTFENAADRTEHNLLILDKNNIKVGLLNYTYGTNGRAIPKPTMVNLIDTVTMLSDIEQSKAAALDKLIVMVHWGKEYQSEPTEDQIEIAEFLFKNGVDIIVGSHPHVLQKMEYSPPTDQAGEQLIAYSLGNFVSDQRTRKRDGGAMLQLTLTKKHEDTRIADYGYHLTWVNKPRINGKRKYEVLPCASADSTWLLTQAAEKKMKLFLADARALLEKENVAVKEIKTDANSQ